MANRKPLTKREMFAKEFIVDLNATQAAIRAGYSGESAKSEGSRLLSFADVQNDIQGEMEARIERTQINGDRVLEEIAAIGFSNIADFVDFGAGGVTLKESADMDRDLTRCISEVSETSGEKSSSVKFKLHSKLKALEDLAEHLGLLKGDGTSVAVINVQQPLTPEQRAEGRKRLQDPKSWEK